jgi:phage FluMu protein Com
MGETWVQADIEIRCGECDHITKVHMSEPSTWLTKYIRCEGCDKPYDIDLAVEDR